MDLVDAEEGRGGLEYLVGLNVWGLLWKKMGGGLRGGGVESGGVGVIWAGEKEMRGFEGEEYWRVDVDREKGGRKFSGKVGE